MGMNEAKKKEWDRIESLLEVAVPFAHGEGVQRCPSCGSKLELVKPLGWDNGVCCPCCEKRYSWIWWRQHSSEWKWRDNGTALAGYYGEDVCPQIPDHCERICSYAFSNATVDKVAIPTSVKVVEKYSFSNNPHLTQVSLPEGLCRIEEGMFMGCDNLEAIQLPTTLTYIGKNAFSGCTALKQIAFPASVRMIDEYAFSGSGLTSLVLTGTCLIGFHAFEECRQLRKVSLHGVTKIGNSAFSGCIHLSCPKLDDGLLSIGDDAFNSCTALGDVEIPSSVYEIGNHAFANIPHVLVHLDESMHEYAEHFSHFWPEVDEKKCYLVEPTSRIIYYLEVDA